jgi:predicted O-methyltransferase YrrM
VIGGHTMRTMELETVAAAVENVPYMSPAEGRVVYDHVRRERPEAVLDLGTAHGVSSAYIAAALEANGHGHVTTVESSAVRYENPTAEELLGSLGLSHRVSIDRRFSTYTWFLKEEIQARSDAAGNCEPAYDFCYLDGAKDWTIDGLTVLLVERLLRDGGWLLMDDLDWTFSSVRGDSVGIVTTARLSRRERTEPHLRAVFDLIVKQHPSFTELRVEDGWWGWARKAPGERRRLTIETRRSLPSYVVSGLRLAKRRLARSTG